MAALKLAAALGLLALPLALAAAPSSPLQPGDHAVAWVASKRVVFVKKWETGVNTAVAAEIKPAGKGAWQVKVSIPLAGFHSGNETRDADVAAMLKVDKQPALLFESRTQSARALSGLRAHGGKLEGELRIGGKGYPLAFDVASDGKSLSASAQTGLKALEIDPSPYELIAVAKINDPVALFLQFDVSKIKGQDKIQ